MYYHIIVCIPSTSFILFKWRYLVLPEYLSSKFAFCCGSYPNARDIRTKSYGLQLWQKSLWGISIQTAYSPMGQWYAIDGCYSLDTSFDAVIRSPRFFLICGNHSPPNGIKGLLTLQGNFIKIWHLSCQFICSLVSLYVGISWDPFDFLMIALWPGYSMLLLFVSYYIHVHSVGFRLLW